MAFRGESTATLRAEVASKLALNDPEQEPFRSLTKAIVSRAFLRFSIYIICNLLLLVDKGEAEKVVEETLDDVLS